jgi:hypothetical protein
MDPDTLRRRAALLRDDPAIRLQRRIGLARADGLSVGRRAVFWALLGWLPIAGWALAGGRAFSDDGESLLVHYGVNVRLLVAVPLMIVAEGLLLSTVLRLAAHGVSAGVFGGDATTLARIGAGLVALRDRAHVWVLAAGAGLGWLAVTGDVVVPADGDHALGWTGPDAGGSFGAIWYLWVARPIFIACVAVWVWRAVLLGLALRRLAPVGLRLVPTHPDRVGGLGFLDALPKAFGLVAFSISAVAASGWAHAVAQHGANVADYRVQMVVTVLSCTAVFIAPMLVLSGPMSRARKAALLAYGALVARHGDALHRRWIGGERVDDPLLDSPEIGPAADAAVLYESAERMLPVPLRPATVAAVAIPAALPMVAVLAIQIPVVDLLKAVAGALL